MLILVAGIGALTAGAGFGWFVAISWRVLRAALGTGPLIAVLMVVAVTAGAWGSVALRRLRQPAVPVGRRARAGVALVSLLATVCGVVAVPATRARLEINKCRHIAPADTTSQSRCQDWLRSRRQWWTVGLSHGNG